jgi:DnaJ family protein A protein 2
MELAEEPEHEAVPGFPEVVQDSTAQDSPGFVDQGTEPSQCHASATSQASELNFQDDDEVSDPKTHYEVLRVSLDATYDDIRKAYKRQCIKHHPDKGGSRERFDSISRAYTVLSDPFLRRAYDEGGDEQVEEVEADAENGACDDADDKEQSEALVAPCLVPLETAFSGGQVELPFVRIVCCAACRGSGTAGGAGLLFMECCGCGGTGQQARLVQLGNMVLQQPAICPMCSGQKRVRTGAMLCQQCGGEQLVEEKGMVLVEVPSGVAEHERIVAKGAGHQMPHLAPGDVVAVCQLQAHERFFRKGDDLLVEQEVPLRVAICGGSFKVKHLAGNHVSVRVPRGAVLAPGAVKCLPGEGMPKRHNPHLRGDMVLRIRVAFPASLPEDVASQLDDILAGVSHNESEVENDPCDMAEPAEEVYLADFDLNEFGRTMQARTEVYQASASHSQVPGPCQTVPGQVECRQM